MGNQTINRIPIPRTEDDDKMYLCGSDDADGHLYNLTVKKLKYS